MPDGADAIVVQEETVRQGEQVVVKAPVGRHDNLRPPGLDFRDGEPLLPAGRRLTPRDVALAAAANYAEVTVRRRVRVAILATGDELVAPGQAIGPFQIVASNNYAVAGIVAAAGGEAVDLGIARDTIEALGAAFAQA